MDLHEILNTIFYRERTGCAWDMLPHDLPPAKTVYDYFNKWSTDGTWERLNGIFARRVRQSEGRDAELSAAMIDSQSVKTTEKGANAATIQSRRCTDRKRHLLVDVLGLVLLVVFTPPVCKSRMAQSACLSAFKVVIRVYGWFGCRRVAPGWWSAPLAG
jgi:putative transposase